jgi:hypothetical protein
MIVEPAFASTQAWVEQVTGGGENDLGFYTEWTALSVRRDGTGALSGMYEYANEGLQNWRYHGEPDCLAISADGTKAVVIGPVTLSQGPDAPPLGTRVAFAIADNGSGDGVDRAGTLFAGNLSCADALAIFAVFPQGINYGNYTIAQR